jgi:hypothetical protein
MANRMSFIDEVLRRLFSISPDDDETLDKVLDLLSEDQREKLLALLIASSSEDFNQTPESGPPSPDHPPPSDPLIGKPHLMSSVEQHFDPLEFSNVLPLIQLISLNSKMSVLSSKIKSLSEQNQRLGAGEYQQYTAPGQYESE